ncbi:UDP-4-amino-4,6-dideoxy-N-acetyl-beta-L-altrosamine transaminase [Lederbergia sp. NSJ-179]|uniref:UDP-4-amino-4, 6-dideoxy-N-acetyl-beta-L-altrosamine transaminase n=1 Tax=Lederbergia sp. NSJ-179 TaxID=2931402 RepID=UPI001FD2A187|nr:UDP-4-amino-4,6-dideoxy-N-acetyl-beta-L-altrosamine transaminase [Lederbergia sp. NSJ-179]MCJ7841378.1 UDP-4-amino-4,6-dideoxy-N-acetyl-beta-L-altrosamine transaminase [Lederbergia sp. NSJ-179]
MKESSDIEPVRDSFLPYGRQFIDQEDIQAVINVLKSDYLTTGPEIHRFEKRIAEYVGAKYAVAFSNGTAALHAACFAAGIQQDDEVITTPLTFAASANCVLYQGGNPVFADIDEQTYNLDPEEVRKKITSKTKAMIPVDFTGQPVCLDKIIEIAKEHDLVVIEDAAHALGSTYKGKKVGSISDMTMFSFHPVKQITTGEGGMITTNHKEYYEKLVQFRSHGITRDREKLMNDHGPWYYEMQHLGFNYRMTDIQAALGNSQLNKLDRFIFRRREIAIMYQKAFKDMDEVILPLQGNDGQSSWHLFILRFKSKKLFVDRKTIYTELTKQNIGVNVHYIPVYLFPYYQQLGYQQGLCPVAEKVYEEMITLPLHPSMTDEDVQDVITAVKKVIQKYSTNKGIK